MNEIVKKESIQVPKELESIAENYLKPKYYFVNGQKIPDASYINNLGRLNKIKTKTILIEKTDTYAKATVMAFFGNENNPTISSTATVIHLYKDLLQMNLMTAINNKDQKRRLPENAISWSQDDNGLPIMVLNNEDYAFIIYDRYLQCRKFAERDAETKAETRAIKKLLGVEFREDEEIEHEIDEIRTVQESMGNTDVKIEKKQIECNTKDDQLQKPTTNGDGKTSYDPFTLFYKLLKDNHINKNIIFDYWQQTNINTKTLSKEFIQDKNEDFEGFLNVVSMFYINKIKEINISEAEYSEWLKKEHELTITDIEDMDLVQLHDLWCLSKQWQTSIKMA